jgi:hypothetical protein
MRNAVDAGNRQHLWQPVRVGPTPFAASAVASNGDVHLFALDRHDGLWHTLRAANGDWPVPWGDVQQAIRDHGNPDVGPTKAVACAVASNGDVHVFVLDQHDGLWHTVRAANGDWPVPWGDVQQAIRDQGHPDVGPTKAVACARVPSGDIHVFVLDQHDGLWHTLRALNGDWPFGWGDVQQAIRDQNYPHIGPTKAVACATAANGDVHVFAIDQLDGLWHTLRLANGDWPFGWGDVRAVVP